MLAGSFGPRCSLELLKACVESGFGSMTPSILIEPPPPPPSPPPRSCLGMAQPFRSLIARTVLPDTVAHMQAATVAFVLVEHIDLSEECLL